MMNIDLDSVKQGLSTLTMALGLLKQAKDLIPKGPKKTNIDEALQQAERQLKLAESQVAHGLRYELCRKHFPPEVMLSSDNTHWKCPVCENERATSASVGVVGLQGKSRWE